MKQITEDYCSFEVAKLLKEKGFDEPTMKSYYVHVIEGVEGHMLFSHDLLSCIKKNEYLCPTHQMALKWLRERPKIAYNIFVFSDGGLGELHYRYEIQEIDNELLQCNGSIDTETKIYESCGQAVEDALLYVLKNLI